MVWDAEGVETLLDSVVQEYPIGLLLLWESYDNLKERDPLDLKLPQNSKIPKLWLLDGQQRLVSLSGAFTNRLKLGKKDVKYRAFYDLKERKFAVLKKSDIEGTKPKKKAGEHYIPLDELFVKNKKRNEYSLNEGLLRKFAGLYLSDLNHLYLKFSALKIPCVTESKSLPIALKIFERLNNTGTQLSVVDLMVATTFKPDFNLRDKLTELRQELVTRDFDISDMSILQAMSACIKGGVSRDDILESSKGIKDKWDEIVESLKSAIGFLRTNKIVSVSRFFPNEITLSALTYFFHKSKVSSGLTPPQSKALKRYVWLGGLSSRYQSGSVTKVNEDIKDMDKLLMEKDINSLFKYPFLIDPVYIAFEELNLNSSFSKTLLCILANHEPKEFRNNQNVNVQGSFAKADSNTMHHIFPRKVIKVLNSGKKSYEDEIEPFMNSIANISMISFEENRNIWDNNPSVYFKEFQEQNSKLKTALESQFIGDLKEFGLEDDNFSKFIRKRSDLISKYVDKLIKELS
jgi:hypothetical protein